MPADKVRKESTSMFSYVLLVDVVRGERVSRYFRIPKGADRGDGVEVERDQLPEDVRIRFDERSGR